MNKASRKRRFKVNPQVARLSKSELETLAKAYTEGRDISGTPRGQEMARVQAERVHRAFRKLEQQVRIEFTTRDPYSSFDALRADVFSNKRMYVYTGASETPLWDEQTNWMSRAVHDHDHLLANTDFSAEGELVAYQFTTDQAPMLEALHLSEIGLQAASSFVLGGFAPGPQRLVEAGPEALGIARRFRRNAKKEHNPYWLVWDLAGALRFLALPELMQLLAIHVPREDVFDDTCSAALVLVLAADIVDRTPLRLALSG